MINTIMKKIQEQLGDEYTLSIVEIRRNNVTLAGIQVYEKGAKSGVIVYPDLKDNAPERIDNLVSFVRERLCDLTAYTNETFELDSEKIKEKVRLRITNDPVYAGEFVNWKVDNFYAIPYISIEIESDNADNGILNFKQEHLGHFGVSKKELWDAAMNNIEKTACLLDLWNLITKGEKRNVFEEGVDPDQTDSLAIYSLVSVSENGDFDGNFGASLILPETVQEKLQKLFPNGYYMIPGSIHDFVVMPKTLGFTPEKILSTIAITNDEMLQDPEKLDPHVYIYENGKLKIVV